MSLHFQEATCAIDFLDTGEAIVIKGFGSTELIDRQKETVDPTEFDIQTFMNCPQLLLNHDYVKDDSGNDSAAGIVTLAVASYIAGENPANPLEWVVQAIETDEFVSTWPKRKSPKLMSGHRGLFVVAEVTHPIVKEKILSGELGGFSWRGFSAVQVSANGLRSLKAIDWIELSVVNIPAQNQSTFMVTSNEDPNLNFEISLKDCSIDQIAFDKSKFSLETIKEYTKKLNIHTPIISESTDMFYVSVNEPSQVVDAAKTFAIKVGDVSLIATPKTEDKIMNREASLLGVLESNLVTEKEMPNVQNEKADETLVEKQESAEIVEAVESVEAIKCYLLDLETVKSRFPDVVIELQKTTMLEEVPVELYSLELPVEVAAEATVEEVVAEVVEEEIVAEITEEVIEPVEAEITAEVIEDIVVEAEPSQMDLLIQSMTNLTNAFAASQKPVEAEVVEAEKSAEAIKEEIIADLEEKAKAAEVTAKAVEEQRQEIEKQLAAFQKIVPSQVDRDEKVDSAKSQSESADLFGFYKQVKG